MIHRPEGLELLPARRLCASWFTKLHSETDSGFYINILTSSHCKKQEATKRMQASKMSSMTSGLHSKFLKLGKKSVRPDLYTFRRGSLKEKERGNCQRRFSSLSDFLFAMEEWVVYRCYLILSC